MKKLPGITAKQLVLAILMAITVTGFSQVSVNTTGEKADSSAILDVNSSTKGVLIPRMNSSQMADVSNPADGLMIYNTDDNAFYFYDENQWKKIGEAAKVWDTTGNYIYTYDSVGIGTANPQAPLTVKGRISQTGVGKSVYLGKGAGIKNNASSGLYNVGIGYNALTNNVSGKNNVAIGGYSIQNNANGNGNTQIGYILPFIGSDSYYNTATGYNALFFSISDNGDHNTALGSLALSLNINGKYNTAAGYYALNKNTTDKNTGFGYKALRLTTSGYSNAGFGDFVLESNTTGHSNNAAGSHSMLNNDEGFNNTALGDWALYSNTSGYGNVAAGNEALTNNVTGNINVALGNKAGHSNINGIKNIFIGYQAGYNETGSYKLYIDNSSTSKPLIGGDFYENEVYLNGKTGIGTESPNEALEVANPNTTGSHSGRMIVSDGKGSARRALLFVSPNHDDSDTNARIEAFNYGSWSGCNLEINNVGHGKTLFYGDVDINAAVKIGSGSGPAEAGMLKLHSYYNYGDFEGYDGSHWVSLTKKITGWGNPPLNYQNASSVSSDGEADDYFGNSVDILGDYSIAGAYLKDVSGNYHQGSAYIFHRNGDNWEQQAILAGSDVDDQDWFGSSVAIDGDKAVVGAGRKSVNGNNYQGKAYVFYRNGNTWPEQGELTASDGSAFDNFGNSVDIDGNYIIVGAYGKDVGGNSSQGEAYIYYFNGSTWTEQAKLTASNGSSNDEFGESVSISGDYAAVTGGTEFYVFHRSGSSWTQQAAVNPDGSPFSISIDGNYLIVASGDNVFVYHRTSGGWSQQMQLEEVDNCSDVAISGDYAIVGMENETIGGNQSQGKAAVYHRNGSVWSKVTDISASDGEENDHFGTSVAINGNYIITGADGKTVNGDQDRGKVYYFKNN